MSNSGLELKQSFFENNILQERMASLKPFEHFATDAIHAGQDPEKWNSRAVIPPISMATTFKQDNPGETHVRILFFMNGGGTRV